MKGPLKNSLSFFPDPQGHYVSQKHCRNVISYIQTKTKKIFCQALFHLFYAFLRNFLKALILPTFAASSNAAV